MICVDVTKQTSFEFKGYFNDCLNYQIRKTFNPKDDLMFVTYQPNTLTLSAVNVIEHTNQLFGEYRYVEVIEQTYKTSKKYNDGNYIDGYHSHLLIRTSDYNSIKDRLEGLDIVAKVTFDLDGLVNKYLIKQAGNTYNRILPIQNIPINKSESITIPEPINVSSNRINIEPQNVLRIYQTVLTGDIISDHFKKINKIYWIHMFIDDT